MSQEATSAELEESAVKEDVEKGVGESFDSIFGKDDDLDLPEEPVAAPVAEQAAEETAPSAELDSIDSEVSNASRGCLTKTIPCRNPMNRTTTAWIT